MAWETLDLNDEQDLRKLSAVWRYGDGYVPGEPNGGLVNQRADSPARFVDYDDSSWPECPDITKSVSTGFCFGWYRLTITLPKTINGFSFAGKRIYFATTIDDYGELWIDGACDLGQGRAGHGAVSGHNAAQRVLVSESAVPGARHVIACLAVNGPLGVPAGGIWMRYARLEFE